MAKKKEDKRTKKLSQTLHRKQKIEQHESSLKPGMNSKTNSTCNIIDKNVDIIFSEHDVFME